MVDIEKDHVVGGVRGAPGLEPAEEIAQHQPAAGFAAEAFAQRNKTGLVPFDDRGERVDHLHRSHAWIGERLAGRIAEAQTADEDAQIRSAGRGEAADRQFGFADREQAGHQVLVAEDHLHHVRIDGGDPAAAQDERPHGCGAIVQLLEQTPHALSPRSRRSRAPAAAG